LGISRKIGLRAKETCFSESLMYPTLSLTEKISTCASGQHFGLKDKYTIIAYNITIYILLS
jgi:hypothetical protein